MLQCVALYCSVSKIGQPHCCNVFQCIAVCCIVLRYVALCCGVLQCVVNWAAMLLQCVAVCCSVLQRAAVRRASDSHACKMRDKSRLYVCVRV